MKKLAIVVLALGLGACTLPTVHLASQVNLNTIEGLAAGYGIILNAENTLKSLPLCLTGTTPSATNICVKRSLMNRLMAADKIAYTAVVQAETFVKNNPTISPANYISSAQQALLGAQAIINSTHTGG